MALKNLKFVVRAFECKGLVYAISAVVSAVWSSCVSGESMSRGCRRFRHRSPSKAVSRRVACCRVYASGARSLKSFGGEVDEPFSSAMEIDERNPIAGT